MVKFRKNKNRTSTPVEGIVVGGNVERKKKPKFFKPKPKMISPSTKLSDSPRPRFRHPRFILLGVTLLLAAGIGGFILFSRGDSPGPTTADPENQLPEGYVRPEQLKDLQSVQGTIVNYTAEMIEVKTGGNSSYQVTITPSTLYTKGITLSKGSHDELSSGMQVQIVYDKTNNEAHTIWYGY